MTLITLMVIITLIIIIIIIIVTYFTIIYYQLNNYIKVHRDNLKAIHFNSASERSEWARQDNLEIFSHFLVPKLLFHFLSILLYVFPISSVASFLVLGGGGGGGQAPQMYRQKKNVYVTYAHASASKTLFIGLYFQVLKYMCIYNQCSSLLLKYGMAL